MRSKENTRHPENKRNNLLRPWNYCHQKKIAMLKCTSNIYLARLLAEQLCFLPMGTEDFKICMKIKGFNLNNERIFLS